MNALQSASAICEMNIISESAKYLALFPFLYFISFPVINMFSGNLNVSDNTNVIYNGVQNEGRVDDNSNLKLTVSNTKLDLKDNSNLEISGEHPSIKASGCSNTQVGGNGNEVDLKKNSNAVLKGNGNHWVANDNSNLDVIGNRMNATLIDNSNAKIEADDITLVAEQNSNLKVVGDGGNVIVKGTANHYLQKVGGFSDTKVVQNLFAVKGDGRGWISGWIHDFTSKIIGIFLPHENGPLYSLSNVNFHIEYVEKAVIDRNRYNLGMFKFQLDSPQFKTMQLRMDQSSGALNLRSVNSGEVLVSATDSNGVLQELKVQGPRVQIENAPAGIINVGLVGSKGFSFRSLL